MSDKEINPYEKALQLLIYIEAIEAYKKAYRLTEQAYDNKDTGQLFTVAPVLLAFAVEKSIKGLVLFYDENNKVAGHNLKELFLKLDDETQARLVLLSPAKPRHFWRALNRNADAFVTWRYIEEKEEEVYFIDEHIMRGIVENALAFLYSKLISQASELNNGLKITSRRQAKYAIISPYRRWRNDQSSGTTVAES